MNKTITYESALVNSGDAIDFDNRDYQVELTISPENKFISGIFIGFVIGYYTHAWQKEDRG